MKYTKETLENHFFKIESIKHAQDVIKWFEAHGVECSWLAYSQDVDMFYGLDRQVLYCLDKPPQGATLLKFKSEPTSVAIWTRNLPVPTAAELHIITTMRQMRSWAKFHNEGWVADWKNHGYKYGIIIEKGLSVDEFKQFNPFIFGISVKTESLAQQMLEEFRTDLEKIQW